MVKYDNDFETGENKIKTKDKIEQQHDMDWFQKLWSTLDRVGHTVLSSAGVNLKFERHMVKDNIQTLKKLLLFCSLPFVQRI